MSSLGWLRRQAVGWSLPRSAGTLAATLAEIEFVQADPIRAPARAQDLILRHRVRGYRVGDLDRHYPALDVDEDRLYAYGFLARRLRRYLYPRRNRHASDGQFVLTDRAADVLAFVRERGVTHPRDVQAHFGPEPTTNDWGGTSSATTLDLERLRHYGFLRVADGSPACAATRWPRRWVTRSIPTTGCGRWRWWRPASWRRLRWPP